MKYMAKHICTKCGNFGIPKTLNPKTEVGECAKCGRVTLPMVRFGALFQNIIRQIEVLDARIFELEASAEESQ